MKKEDTPATQATPPSDRTVSLQARILQWIFECRFGIRPKDADAEALAKKVLTTPIKNKKNPAPE